MQIPTIRVLETIGAMFGIPLVIAATVVAVADGVSVFVVTLVYSPYVSTDLAAVDEYFEPGAGRTGDPTVVDIGNFDLACVLHRWSHFAH